MDFAVLMPTGELHVAEAWSYTLWAMFLWWRQAKVFHWSSGIYQ